MYCKMYAKSNIAVKLSINFLLAVIQSLCKHSLTSSRNLSTHERYLQGYVLIPITVHLSIKAADFGPGEILHDTEQWLQA